MKNIFSQRHGSLNFFFVGCTCPDACCAGYCCVGTKHDDLFLSPHTFRGKKQANTGKNKQKQAKTWHNLPEIRGFWVESFLPLNFPRNPILPAPSLLRRISEFFSVNQKCGQNEIELYFVGSGLDSSKPLHHTYFTSRCQQKMAKRLPVEIDANTHALTCKKIVTLERFSWGSYQLKLEFFTEPATIIA